MPWSLGVIVALCVPMILPRLKFVVPRSCGSASWSQPGRPSACQWNNLSLPTDWNEVKHVKIVWFFVYMIAFLRSVLC